jgi:hypothetical protein
LLPAFFSQAFASFGAPLYAGRDFFFIDVVTAFAAFDAGLVGKHLNFVSAVGTFVQGYLQISSILTRAVADHGLILLKSISFPYSHFKE